MVTYTSDEQATLLQRLSDVDTLRELKATYGVLVDGLVEKLDPKNLDRLAAMFTEDVKLDFGERAGSFQGQTAVRKFFGETLPQQREWIWHAFHSPLIEINGGHARCRWTVQAALLSRGKSVAGSEVLYGRYDDEYVRTPDGWKQCKLIFTDESR